MNYISNNIPESAVQRDIKIFLGFDIKTSTCSSVKEACWLSAAQASTFGVKWLMIALKVDFKIIIKQCTIKKSISMNMMNILK